MQKYKEFSVSFRAMEMVIPKPGHYSKENASQLLAHHAFDKDAILKKRLPYERLDQLTIDLLLGAR